MNDTRPKIYNEALLRAKESVAKRKVLPKSSLSDSRVPEGQRRVPAMVAMAPIVRDLEETSLSEWKLTISGAVKHPVTLDILDLETLGVETFVEDIHCVTTWSKLDQSFEGVDFSKILALVAPTERAKYVIFESKNDGYSTNCVLEELRSNTSFLATKIDGKPISLAYGWPIRMIIPHLYYWKSSKYITNIRFVEVDEPGFWETRGYHNHGDPWKNERYDEE